MSDALDRFESVLRDYTQGNRSADDVDEAREALRAALTAPPAPAVPAGWQLVPVEPTSGMVAAYLAGNHAYWKAVDDGPQHPAKWRNGTPAEATAAGYAAMLAAAPQPAPQPAQDGKPAP